MKQFPFAPRSAVEALAPKGTRRRAACNGLRRVAQVPLARYRAFMAPVREDRRLGQTPWQILRRIVDRNLNHSRLVALATMPQVLVEPLTLDQMNLVLRHARLPQLRAGRRRVGTGVDAAARYILARYLGDASLRRRYPDGLSEGPDGGFCAALCRELGGNAGGVENLRAAFGRRYGDRPRQAYDLRWDWRTSYPLALTPAGRQQFLSYLLSTAGRELDLSVEEILWFHLESLRDPHAGLVTTYLLSPEWQERHPHGLAPSGFPELCRWIARDYGLTETGWLADLPTPTGADVPAQSPPGGCGVNILGYFSCPSGLQTTAVNTAEALRTAGIPVGCRNVPVKMEHDVAGRDGLRHTEVYPVSILHLSPIYDLATQYNKASLWRRPGVYRIGVWYWELEIIPADWPERAAEFDEIWAPTSFLHRAMVGALPAPVVPMLPGVPAPGRSQLSTAARFGIDPDKFLFLFMFDMPSIMARKNPLAVVEAYRRAFGRAAGTQLAIKVSRGSSRPDEYARLAEAVASVGGVLIDGVLSRAETDGLLHRCDAYVSLHRSEGLGLTLAESMLLGKPVIATGYSGNLDFTTADNSRLIPFQMVPVASASEAYPKEGMWADPCVETAAGAMRWIADNPTAARAMAERGRRDAQRLFSLAAYGERLRERLDEIARQRFEKALDSAHRRRRPRRIRRANAA